MPNYFVIRTSDDEKEWIWQEIQQGRLRQGWGISNTRLPEGKNTQAKMKEWCQRYREQAQQAWSEEISEEKAKSRYEILRPLVEIQQSDRIVIPKMPAWGSFCIAIAKSVYDFDSGVRADQKDDDFRHVIPLEGGLRIVPHLEGADAQIVASSLKGYQTAVNVIYKANVGSAIEALIASEAPISLGDVGTLFGELGRVATGKIVDELIGKLRDLQPNVFELLIGKMLELGGYRVLKTNQYDGQGGDADIVAEAELPPLGAAFEQQSILLVQAKKKSGIDYDDVEAVRQVVKMGETYPGAALVVISTADGFTDECVAAARDEKVVLINGRALARLLLRYMP